MKKKVPYLKRIPLISNPIDWKGFVPDKAQLMKNIESAVDNQVQNIIIDLMNEYNNLKSLQYNDINKINKELKGANSGMQQQQYSPKNTSKNKPNDFDLMDDLNALQDFDESGGDPPKSERNQKNKGIRF